MSFLPDIAASKVAGLCGLHKYQQPVEVMFDMLYKHIPTKVAIDALMTAENRRPFNKIKNEVLRNKDIMNIVGRAVRSTKGVENITPILEGVESQARTAIALRYSEYSESVRSLLVDEVRGAVAKQRGIQNENAGLNTYENTHAVEVKDRNTMTFKKTYEKFKLNGRTDGFVTEHNRVVDAKERTRWWTEPPLYDEIQLRVYMELTGAKEAELFESFPDGRTRTTKYENDPIKWSVINSGILGAVEKMQSAIDNPAELRDIVFANTV